MPVRRSADEWAGEFLAACFAEARRHSLDRGALTQILIERLPGLLRAYGDDRAVEQMEVSRQYAARRAPAEE